MHGDIDHANDAVLTKDDYEKYYIKMEQFLSALKGDLISKLLFLSDLVLQTPILTIF